LEFAQRSLERQGPRGRAVVFETVAPADTIICAVSEAVGGSEHEFVVDGLRVGAVRVVRRFAS